MQTIIKLEEAGMFLLSIYLFAQLHFAWWWFPALILLPDISMIGYAINNKVGAFCYNIAHHKAIAIAVYIAGLCFKNETIQLIGLILFGHSSMDRMMGYGLKYEEGFKFTHLGTIGKN
ncbi:MAG: DUF4260 domain-containing protein [Bacteroidetes bacterium]|nr:DUF4260 domain-containing protein [Bacteroidota bacterium]MBS1932492.1 DUF4260 domain-containing protein [Bacteroidota bacterium]